MIKAKLFHFKLAAASKIYKNKGGYKMAKQIDPVCGMQVEEQDAVGQAEYEGRTYYFCAEGCKRKFEEETGR